MRYYTKKAAAGILAASMTMILAAVTVMAQEPEDKTIYLITDAQGTVEQVIDPAGEEDAEVSDVPVQIQTTYELDGKEVLPEELAGQSGHLVIRMEYENASEDPYAVMTGMVLDEDKFSEVAVTNGKLLSDGSRMTVVGLAFPGLKEALDLEEDSTLIPQDLVVEADVQDFALELVYTVAFSGTPDIFDDAVWDSLDEMTDSVTELGDAMTDILSGAQDLSDGAGTLSSGLSDITSHNKELTDGAAQVFDALLATVQTQVEAAGVEIAPLTIENYQDVLEDFCEEGIEEQAREQVEAQVDAMGDAVYTAYLESQKDTILAAYVQENADDICKSFLLTQVPADQAAQMTEEQLDAALTAQLETLAEEEKEQILQGAQAQMTEDQIAQILQGAAATLTQEQKDQIREGAIEQGMASEDVQARIAAAKQQAAPLQAALDQLNSYQEFYTGLVSYTDGVQTAADGADDLSTGADTLKDGLNQFDEEGVQVLTDAVQNKLQPVLDYFHNGADSKEGTVKYIYKMKAIEAPSE